MRNARPPQQYCLFGSDFYTNSLIDGFMTYSYFALHRPSILSLSRRIFEDVSRVWHTKGRNFILVYFSSRLSPFISLENKSFHIDCSCSSFPVPPDLNRTCHQKCDCCSSRVPFPPFSLKKPGVSVLRNDQYKQNVASQKARKATF